MIEIMANIKKRKKTSDKPFVPRVVLNDIVEASDFMKGLLEIAQYYYDEQSGRLLSNTIREMFADMAVSFTKKAISAYYPRTVSFKPYEAKMIYLCSSSLGTIKQSFTGFINEIHQKMIV
jgi:hypothetical protein